MFVWGKCSVKRKYRRVKLRTTAALLKGVSVSVCVCRSPLGQKEFNQNKSSFEESSSKPEANQPKVKQSFKLQLYFMFIPDPQGKQTIKKVL